MLLLQVTIDNHVSNWYGVAKQDGVGPFGYAYFQDKKTSEGTNFPGAHWGETLSLLGHGYHTQTRCRSQSVQFDWVAMADLSLL
jgi:hypothetical protein